MLEALVGISFLVCASIHLSGGHRRTLLAETIGAPLRSRHVERKALWLGHAVLGDRGANANRCMPITGSAPSGPSIDCAGLAQKLCAAGESPSSTHSPPPSSPSSPSSRVRENKAEATERSEVARALGCGAQVDRGMGFHPPHLFRFSALQDLAVKRGAYPISQ
jgi:hypothetical protein